MLGMVHAARGKSNVLSPAAKSFVTWDREAVYNFVLHERHAGVVECVCTRFQKGGFHGTLLQCECQMSKPLTFQARPQV